VGSNRGVLGLRRAGQSRFEPKTALHGQKSLKAALRCQKSSEAPLARRKVHKAPLRGQKCTKAALRGQQATKAPGILRLAPKAKNSERFGNRNMKPRCQMLTATTHVLREAFAK
jgi:hypothetical protein